jgi:hypothetical protein
MNNVLCTSLSPWFESSWSSLCSRILCCRCWCSLSLLIGFGFLLFMFVIFPCSYVFVTYIIGVVPSHCWFGFGFILIMSWSSPMFMIFWSSFYQLIVIAIFVCNENQEKKPVSVLFMQHLFVVMHAMYAMVMWR